MGLTLEKWPLDASQQMTRIARSLATAGVLQESERLHLIDVVDILGIELSRADHPRFVDHILREAGLQVRSASSTGSPVEPVAGRGSAQAATGSARGAELERIAGLLRLLLRGRQQADAAGSAIIQNAEALASGTSGRLAGLSIQGRVDPVQTDSAPDFSRFNGRARRVIVIAHDEARMLNHDHVGTAHLLLGLLPQRNSVAAEELASALGRPLEDLYSQVEGVVGQGRHPQADRLPFAADAQRALGFAAREADEMGRNYVGTGHILLGLLRESEGVGARILLGINIDQARLRARLTGSRTLFRRDGVVRVYELAAELEVDTRDLMQVMRDLRIGVQSTASPVSEADARRVALRVIE